MSNDSVTDFSILINDYDALKTEISSIRAISALLLEGNPYSIKNLYWYLRHIDKLSADFENHMSVFFEKVTYFCCSPGN